MKTNKLSITDLPQTVLALIFQHLDVKSRVRCEVVCRRFHQISSFIYVSHPWKELSLNRKTTLVISAWCDWRDIYEEGDTIQMQSNQIRISVINRCLRYRNLEAEFIKRNANWFSHLLRSIFDKFITYVDMVEIHFAEFNSHSIETLIDHREMIRELICYRCVYGNAQAVDTIRLMAAYGNRLVIKDKCSCAHRHSR